MKSDDDINENSYGNFGTKNESKPDINEKEHIKKTEMTNENTFEIR